MKIKSERASCTSLGRLIHYHGAAAKKTLSTESANIYGARYYTEKWQSYVMVLKSNFRVFSFIL